MAIIIRAGEIELFRYEQVNAECLHATVDGMRTARWEYNGRVTCQINGSGRYTYSDLEFIATPADAEQYLKELKERKHDNHKNAGLDGTGPELPGRPPKRARSRRQHGGLRRAA